VSEQYGCELVDCYLPICDFVVETSKGTDKLFYNLGFDLLGLLLEVIIGVI
jgi:hypothetical protein